MLGLGIVGAGVARSLAAKAATLHAELGRSVQLQSVLVRDPTKPREAELPPGALTTDPADVLDNPDIDIVVELLGRVHPPYEYICRAIRNGKHVVTANKDVMALHGAEILRLAQEHDVDVYYEASVGGGIPLIGSFRQDLVANEIHQIHAIINGTTNYILTRMESGQVDFDVALSAAQKLGYAESDPTSDVEGVDAAYKLAILASIAFRLQVAPDEIYREGVGSLAAADFRYAREFGYAIKLLAIGKRDGDWVELRVHPTLVAQEHLLADVHDVFNAVHVQGDLIGTALFYGRGAGSAPTSSAIVADIVDSVHNITAGVTNRIPFHHRAGLRLRPIADVVSRAYVRLWVADRPGVLAQIAHVFGDHDISIAACVQKETSTSTQGAEAEIVVLTHPAREADVQRGLRVLADLPVVRRIANHLRIEDLN